MSMLPSAPWLLVHRMLKPNQPINVLLYEQDYVLWQARNGSINYNSEGLPTHRGDAFRGLMYRGLKLQ